MAEVEAKWFTKGGKNLVEQEVGWVSGPVKVALITTGFAFDQDAPESFNDLAASEATGTAYTAGGAEILNRSVVIDTSSNETRLMGDPVQWPNSSIGARGAVIYINAGAKPVLGYIDFIEDRTSVDGLFRLEWPTSGVLRTRAL